MVEIQLRVRIIAYNYPERVAIPGKEYEKLWQKYQTEGIAHNMTLQIFCSMNNVPYNWHSVTKVES